MRDVNKEFNCYKVLPDYWFFLEVYRDEKVRNEVMFNMKDLFLGLIGNEEGGVNKEFNCNKVMPDYWLFRILKKCKVKKWGYV